MGWGGWAQIGPRWPQAGAGTGGRMLRKGPAFSSLPEPRPPGLRFSGKLEPGGQGHPI